MDGTNILKESTRVTTPVASNTLSVNVFTARKRLWPASGQSPSAKRSPSWSNRHSQTANSDSQAPTSIPPRSSFHQLVFKGIFYEYSKCVLSCTEVIAQLARRAHRVRRRRRPLGAPIIGTADPKCGLAI